MEQQTSVAAAIAMIRLDLADAMARGLVEDVRFDVTDVVLTLRIALGKTGEGNTAARFWVVEIGGGASISRDEVQELTVHLRPVSYNEAGESVPLRVSSNQSEPGL